MPEQPVSQGPQRILVIDDEKFLLEALETLLGPYDAVVSLFSDSAAALAAATSEPFDLVITDLAMPGMSGEELVSEIRKRTGTAPKIVFMTGNLDVPAPSRGLGECRILQKPFDRHGLRKALKGWVADRDK